MQTTLALARFAAWTDEVVTDRVVNGVGPLVSGLAAGSAEADEWIIDRGVTLASAAPVAVGRWVRRLHTGLVQTYAVVLFGVVVAGLILIVVW